MRAPDDKISSITRIVAVLVVPILWLAFLILYFFPDTTGERFAWAIKPHMTSLYMGAGYLGGSWLFINAIFRDKWHRVAGGFLPVTAFTWAMLIATFLHWDRFSHGRAGFYAWLVLYIVTPFLVPGLWVFNRQADPVQPEPDDPVNPAWMRWPLALFGLTGLGFTLASFLVPDLIINAWAWPLTPLTGRVLAGWGMLLSVGGIVMAFERRWSAWRVPLQSIVVWHILVLVGAAFNPADFTQAPLNWFTAATTLVLAGLIGLLVVMDRRRDLLQK